MENHLFVSSNVFRTRNKYHRFRQSNNSAEISNQ